MSLTKPIPKKIREELEEDPFMQKCCLSDYHICEGRIQWHHHLKFAGKRVNEKWCILPVCELAHKQEAGYKEELNNIMCSRATYDELIPYSKAINYLGIKAELDYV